MAVDNSATDYWKQQYQGLPNDLGPVEDKDVNTNWMRLQGLRYGGQDGGGDFWVSRGGKVYHFPDLPSGNGSDGSNSSGGNAPDNSWQQYAPPGYGASSNPVLDKGPVLNNFPVTGNAPVFNLPNRGNTTVTAPLPQSNPYQFQTVDYGPTGINPVLNTRDIFSTRQAILDKVTGIKRTLPENNQDTSQLTVSEVEAKKLCSPCYPSKNDKPAFQYWEWSKVDQQISAREKTSTRINQLPLDLCAMAVTSEYLARTDKEGYRKVVTCLYFCGYVEYQNPKGQIYSIDSRKKHLVPVKKKIVDVNPNLDEDLKYLTDEDGGERDGRGTGPMAGADFILLASLRWDLNRIFEYYAQDKGFTEELTGATTPKNLIYLLNNFIGMDNVRKRIRNYHTVFHSLTNSTYKKLEKFFNDVEAFYKGGGYVVFYINANMIDQDPDEQQDSGSEDMRGRTLKPMLIIS